MTNNYHHNLHLDFITKGDAKKRKKDKIGDLMF